MIEVRRLRVLREVAVQGSMAAAADALSFTPSAVSQQIAALEREAGVELVERRGRGVALTDAGWALVRRADVILAELSRAEADLDAIRHARSGTLSIGAFPTAGTRLLPTALRRFARHHPDVQMRLTELEPEQSLPLLRAGELDVVLAYECDLVPLAHDGFEEETLFSDPMLVVHAAGGSDTRGMVDLAAFEEADWIAPTPGTGIHEFTLRACQAAGYEPLVTSIWTDFQVVQSLASQGFGVAFAPLLALSPPRAGVVVRHTTANLQRRVFAAWRSGTARAPLVNAIVEAFRDATERIGAGVVRGGRGE